MCKIDWQKQYLKHPLWLWVLDIVVISLLTILFSWLLVRSTFTGDLFTSAAKIETPQLIDLYTLSTDNANLKTVSDVVLMPTDGCSRQDIATVLQTLQSLPVAAIGVDVTFPYHDSEDEPLLDAIKADPRIVMASKEDGSYFEQELSGQGVLFGSILLDINTRYDIVRTFTPSLVGIEDTFPSFEAQLAQLVQPNTCDLFPMDESSYIAYAQVKFDTIPALALLSEDVRMDEITEVLNGKVVLLGDLETVQDTYRTPLQPDMPGVVIHAYILNTILQHRLINELPTWVSWLLACLVAFGFAWGLIFIKWKFDDAEGLVLRTVQIFLALIVVMIGVLAFNLGDYYINVEPIFFALAVQAVTLDIWMGIMKLIYKPK